MSDKDFNKYKKAAQTLKTEVTSDKEKAKELLIKVGVLTKGGNLKPHFRELCTQGKQA